MQPEKLHDALEKKQYERETRAEAQLYNAVGLADIPAHTSIALFTFDGKDPALLVGNNRFWTHSSEIGIRDQEQVNHCLRVPNHPFRVRFLNLMKQVDMTHGEQSMTFSEQGHYVRVMMSSLGANRKLVIYQAQFDDITMERAYDESEQRFDQIMRNLCLLYQHVFFLTAQQDTCEVLIGTQDWAEDEGDTCKGIGGFFAAYAEAMVYPADRARFLAYIDIMAGIEFMDNYLKNGEDFTAVYFYVPAFESAARSYGDEFLMIVEQSDEAQADDIQQSLRDAFHAQHVSVALGCIVCMTPIPDMDAIITKVDREMYKDKGKKKR